MTADPEFAEVRPAPRGGFLGFLSTIPGILTAAAAVITALSGLYFTALSVQTVISSVEAAPIPQDPAEADPNSMDIELSDVTVDDETNQLIADCGAGLTDACGTLLDMLVDKCYAGVGARCDDLYEVSELGSDYEAYGATCGGRF